MRKLLAMGLVYSEIILRNPVHAELEPLVVRCLVDTGSTFLVLPANIATQLKLKALQDKQATMADGTTHWVPYAGPVQISFENRGCFVGALIMGDEVLLGAVPMEDMDLVVIPKTLKLSVNPAHPDAAHGYAK
jgi:clan AA aspartic protease